VQRSAETKNNWWRTNVDKVKIIVSGDDSIVMGHDKDIIEKAFDFLKSASGMNVSFSHKGSIDGADFCKVHFAVMENDRVIAYHKPGNILRKIGVKPSTGYTVTGKQSYGLLRSKVYSAMAMNYRLGICDYLN
jgi:predicted house-cleaning NTP pyrophosphatase (Maf/HAM1 superfamily)